MTLHDFSVQTADGKAFSLREYTGSVVLVVNVASRCGYTPQYTGLQKLYERFKDRKFVVLGFPCNQFGAQEPGSNEDIQEFCEINYGVSFPVFAKIDVNGSETDPLYKWLKHEAPGVLGTEAIKWNFTKFLVSREGKVLHRFAPQDTPETLVPEIEKALGS